MLIHYIIIGLLVMAWSVVMFKAGYEAGYGDGWYKSKEGQKITSIRQRFPDHFS